MLVPSFSFYWLGSLTSDPATGRVYPVQMHGTMYVTPFLGITHIILFVVGFVCIAGMAAIRFWEQRNSEDSN